MWVGTTCLLSMIVMTMILLLCNHSTAADAAQIIVDAVRAGECLTVCDLVSIQYDDLGADFAQSTLGTLGNS